MREAKGTRGRGVEMGLPQQIIKSFPHSALGPESHSARDGAQP